MENSNLNFTIKQYPPPNCKYYYMFKHFSLINYFSLDQQFDYSIFFTSFNCRWTKENSAYST